MTDLASFIDHTALKPFVKEEQIIQLCAQAAQYNFKAVCIPPSYVVTAAQYLKTQQTAVCTVIGFPLGYQTFSVKRMETEEALRHGASEIDLVMNISQFKSDKYAETRKEIEQMTQLVHSQRAIIKVIIETAYLSKEEIQKICAICAEAGVDFVKTSTGFAPYGAKVDDVQWMRQHLPERVQIKASGGIQTLEQAQELIAAGASRLGTSSGIEIMQQIAAIPNKS
jgi:deoxyribose-phosphate aldolase